MGLLSRIVQTESAAASAAAFTQPLQAATVSVRARLRLCVFTGGRQAEEERLNRWMCGCVCCQ